MTWLWLLNRWNENLFKIIFLNYNKIVCLCCSLVPYNNLRNKILILSKVLIFITVRFDFKYYFQYTLVLQRDSIKIVKSVQDENLKVGSLLLCLRSQLQLWRGAFLANSVLDVPSFQKEPIIFFIEDNGNWADLHFTSFICYFELIKKIKNSLSWRNGFKLRENKMFVDENNIELGQLRCGWTLIRTRGTSKDRIVWTYILKPILKFGVGFFKEWVILSNFPTSIVCFSYILS